MPGTNISMLQTVANGLGNLKEECCMLLKNDGLTEGIESALTYGSEEEATEIIMELIQNIADIE